MGWSHQQSQKGDKFSKIKYTVLAAVNVFSNQAHRSSFCVSPLAECGGLDFNKHISRRARWAGEIGLHGWILRVGVGSSELHAT